MKAEIHPLEKIVINGITLRFGMSLSEVEALIGAGQKIGSRYYYFQGEMAIDYKENKVEFIEFSGGVDGICKPMLYDVSAFDIRAEELTAILKSRNNGELCDMEGGHCYLFSHISIGVYREAVPTEIEEMIEEAKVFGNPISADEIEYESNKANHFSTVGVGTVGYYSNSKCN